MTYGNENGFFVELRYEARHCLMLNLTNTKRGPKRHTAVKLGISKELHEMTAISWLDVIALKMTGDVCKSHRVSVDIESPNAITIATLGCLL